MAPLLERRLLVEGRDDQWAISALMIRHGTSFGARAPFDPEIRSTEGVPNLLEAIGVAVKTYDRLGIVVDADEHPAARWAVRGRLVGMNPLDVLPADGFVGAGIHPDTRVGVWMTPDNAARGMRETFLATLVPPGDAAWRYAAEVVAEARARGARCGSTDKPRMSTWLAWQDPEGRPLGTATTSRALGHESPIAAQFEAFFAAC